jgi:hypothetical protein
VLHRTPLRKVETWISSYAFLSFYLKNTSPVFENSFLLVTSLLASTAALLSFPTKRGSRVFSQNSSRMFLSLLTEFPQNQFFFFFLKILSPLSEVTFSLFPANQILFQYDRLSLSSYTIPCRIDVKTQEKTLTTSALSPQKDLVNLELP